MANLSKMSAYYPRHFEERIALLVQRMGEVNKTIGKAGRFGWLNHWGGTGNYENFLNEMAELRQAVEIVLNNDGPKTPVERAYEKAPGPREELDDRNNFTSDNS